MRRIRRSLWILPFGLVLASVAAVALLRTTGQKPGYSVTSKQRTTTASAPSPVEIGSYAFSLDGTRVLAVGNDTTWVWNARTGLRLHTLHPGDVYDSGGPQSAHFTPDAKRIVTVSGDWTARVWDTASGRKLRNVSTTSFDPVLSPDGKRLVLRDAEGGVGVWNIANGGLRWSVSSGLAGAGAPPVAFSPDSKLLAIASPPEDPDKTAWIYTVANGNVHAVLRTASRPAFSPDGTRVLGDSRVYDAATGRLLHLLQPPSIPYFSPDGTRIVTVSSEHKARIWDTATGRPLHDLPAAFEGEPIFSPDGTWVATCGYGGPLRIWAIASGRILHALPDSCDATPAFSPTGKLLVTLAGSNLQTGVARLWDVTSGRLLRMWRPAFAAVLSPDGTRVLIGSSDGSARIRDVKTGRTLETLRPD